MNSPISYKQCAERDRTAPRSRACVGSGRFMCAALHTKVSRTGCHDFTCIYTSRGLGAERGEMALFAVVVRGGRPGHVILIWPVEPNQLCRPARFPAHYALAATSSARLKCVGDYSTRASENRFNWRALCGFLGNKYTRKTIIEVL